MVSPLPTKVRLGWKWMTYTNPQATVLIMAVESFVRQASCLCYYIVCPWQDYLS